MLHNLKMLREEKGISQQKLADEIGLSQQSINKYENHDVEPDFDTLKRLSDFFETSADFIIGNTDIRNKIEKIEKYDLNRLEIECIEKFRILSPKYRKSILSLMDDFINK